LLLGARLDPVALHQHAHTLFAHADAPGQQLLVHAGPTVLAFDLRVNGTHVRQQGFVALKPAGAMIRFTLTSLPVEVPAGADLQHLAHQAHRPCLAAHLPDPSVLCSTSCAKYAAAFFAMSR